MIRHNKEAGQVLPLVAISLAALMGFAGISVDVGYAEYQQREQQSAADAAALGGAQVLVSQCGNATAADAAAIADAAKNGFTNGTNGVTVTAQLGSQLTSGPFAGNTCAVQVQVTAPHPTWFGALFGFKGNVTTQAVAITPTTDGPGGIPPGQGSQPCIQGASTTASSTFSANVTCPPGSSIYLPGSTTFGSGTITSPVIGYRERRQRPAARRVSQTRLLGRCHRRRIRARNLVVAPIYPAIHPRRAAAYQRAYLPIRLRARMLYEHHRDSGLHGEHHTRARPLRLQRHDRLHECAEHLGERCYDVSSRWIAEPQ